ncbi:MAG: prephenate dehydratase [Desulfovibrio sp.]|jgi:chorismate mutase/prephenate dehydratase|nr:prephenate dehydratase [Desulfovibrio sp.]
MQTNSAALDENLRRIRADINETDNLLLELLNRRAALSIEAGRIKARDNSPVFRPSREEEVLDRLRAANPGPLPNEHLLAVYREILSSSRTLQRSLRVAFLGPEGTFSHMACLEYFGAGVSAAPMPGLEHVFMAVRRRECDLGVVPVENSVNGTVVQSMDLFAAQEVYVQAEHFSRIRLCLVSAETTPGAVESVYSHAQALGQCANWLRDKMPNAERISLESSALAARRAAKEKGGAAICHPSVAENLGLNILASGIEDVPDNMTRFFIIGPDEAGEWEDKTAQMKSSILFLLADRPGSLASVLQIFFRAGINLSKLESRPMRGESWKYVFFADLDCDLRAAKYSPLVEELRVCCLRLRLLGSYPKGIAQKA